MPTTQISPNQLLSWGQEVAGDHLRKGADLSHEIAKIASKNQLNSAQIHRIVEEANHTVLEKLRNQGRHNPQFKLASVDDVAGFVYTGRPDAAKTAMDLHASAGELTSSEIVKTAGPVADTESPVALAPEYAESRKSALLEDLMGLRDHIAAYKKQAMSEHVAVEMETHAAVEKVAEMAREYVLRGNSLQDFVKVASTLDSMKGLNIVPFFQTILDNLNERYGIGTDKLGAPLEKSLLLQKLEMEGPNARLVNGNSDLVVALDTIKNKVHDEDRSSRHLLILNRTGEAVAKALNYFAHGQDEIRKIAKAAPFFSQMARDARAGYDSFVTGLLKEAEEDEKKEKGSAIGRLGRRAVSTTGKVILPAAGVAALLGTAGVLGGHTIGNLLKREDYESISRKAREDRT